MASQPLNQHQSPKLKTSMAGYGMLEILISVLVLSVGLLGLAGLQASAIRYNYSAYLRSIAVLQAENIIDRIRANRAGATAGNYNNLSGVPTDPKCTTCTPSQLATRDMFVWNTANAALLPLGQGTVTGNSSLFTVTVRWDNDRIGATGTNCSGNNQVDLTCLQVGVEL